MLPATPPCSPLSCGREHELDRRTGALVIVCFRNCDRLGKRLVIATEGQLTYYFWPFCGASMNRLLFTATLLAINGAGIPAVADGTGRSPVWEYKSMWDPDPGSEHMWLAEDFASFSSMRGHLVLAYAGMMPPENERSDPNIKMYRIVNAEEFFRLNKGNNEYPCAGLPKMVRREQR